MAALKEGRKEVNGDTDGLSDSDDEDDALGERDSRMNSFGTAATLAVLAISSLQMEGLDNQDVEEHPKQSAETTSINIISLPTPLFLHHHVLSNCRTLQIMRLCIPRTRLRYLCNCSTAVHTAHISEDSFRWTPLSPAWHR